MSARPLCQIGQIAVLTMLLAGIPGMLLAQTRTGGWTGTWAASPVRGDPKQQFDRQTLRQVVHTSITGSRARIHLSNLYGTLPLAVDDVHIALRASGSSIVAGTDRTIHFGGLSRVFIPAGSEVVSDPIDFRVPALADVAISFHLPKSVEMVTYHPSALQTSYICEGDMSEDEELTNATITQSYYFLTNLDIQDEASAGSVVALGASITDGYGSAPDVNRRWPNDLAERLIHAGIHVGVLNEGISGNRILASGAGDSVEDRFDRDVISQPGVRWVILSDEPINDLGSTQPPPSADQLIAALRRLVERAHERQIEFLCSTLTPYEGAGYWTPSGETAREKINEFIRSSQSNCDAVVDQDAATHDPKHPTRFLPEFDSGDHLHPNARGLQAIANAIDVNMFSRLVSAPEQKKLTGNPDEK